jgi:annexin A7/11
LYAAGEGRLGTNEVEFNRIFSLESYAQLRLVFAEYQKNTRHSIEKAINSEMSSSVKNAFLTLGKLKFK